MSYGHIYVFIYYFLVCLPYLCWWSVSKVDTAGEVLARTGGEDTGGEGAVHEGDEEEHQEHEGGRGDCKEED